VTVLVVGEALVDVVIRPDGSSDAHPGGSPANVAVGLGRLGHDVTLLTALGDDDHGRLLRDHLSASRVEVLAAPLPRTGVAQARLDAAGVATYDFDIAWDTRELAPPGEPSWLHMGSLGTALEPGATQVRALLDRYDGRATVSYDPNCRPGLSEDRASVEELVRRADVVKASEEDVTWLHPGRDPRDVAREWGAAGPALVVVTLGTDGALAVLGDELLEVGPAPGGPVVDTVGAGDAFTAGLVSALLGTDLGVLDTPAARVALDHAALVARRTCERVGADPPWAPLTPSTPKHG